jgi:thiosulfate sulfurtransferase
MFSSRAKISSITPQKAKEHIEKQESTVIDIRARDVFDQGHIPGAIWVDKDNLAGFIHTADKKKMVICCCYKGVSSLKIAKAIQKAGFSKARSLQGGFEEWSQTFPGLPA